MFVYGGLTTKENDAFYLVNLYFSCNFNAVCAIFFSLKILTCFSSTSVFHLFFTFSPALSKSVSLSFCSSLLSLFIEKETLKEKKKENKYIKTKLCYIYFF